MKINKYIEIARTTNHRFSSMNTESCERIRAVLSTHYEHVGVSNIDELSDLERLVRNRPDLVFLGIKRLPRSSSTVDEISSDIWISDYLDRRGIAYTGSAVHAMKLDFNKEKAKARIRQANIQTAPSFVSVSGQHASHTLPLPFPLFIKPLGGGGGRGVGDDSVARNFAEFQDKVNAIHTINGSSSLVEQYLEGREFSVAILDGYDSGDRVVMPIEIITAKNHRGDRILGSHIKHENNEQIIAIDNETVREAVSELAVDAYEALGGRDLGRIDIRMDEGGNIHFLEANFMPAPGSRYFAGAFEINEGMAYSQLLFNITELAFFRTEINKVQVINTNLSEAFAV